MLDSDRTPDVVYGELFDDVQSARIFADSKTFVDAVPRRDPAAVLDAYRQQRDDPGFELAGFVAANFELPPPVTFDDRNTETIVPVREHIERLWSGLSRAVDKGRPHSTLIPLPAPYIVPGGRFREIYYWDSYFTQLGLLCSGRTDLVESMVCNFAHLIDRVGFVPNGNRTYYITRSQPPMFASMVQLLASATGGDAVYTRFFSALKKEYAFWMAGADDLAEGQACRRVVRQQGRVLNRYWDDSDRPRQESYAEDIELAATADRPASELFRDIRAACESGWDFSSRWLADPEDPTTIRTTQIVPVDLNAILGALEATLADIAGRVGDPADERRYRQRAENRASAIQDLFFDRAGGRFVDLLLPDLRPIPRSSMAMVCPLFFGWALPAQAQQVADRLRADLLRPGGWVTTPSNTGQQWDAPNGWAPLQWLAYQGLRRYGFESDAREGAQRWIDNNLTAYSATGQLAEKYDVETIGIEARGGEYALQMGFGWTNGVLLRLLSEPWAALGEKMHTRIS